MINGKGYSSFDRSKLYSYWNEFFVYENSSLAAITEKELKDEIASQKYKSKPFIDSQQIINIILTRLSKRHKFHEHFHEQFPGANGSSILGMQLYTLILKDDKDWCYFITKHPGHLFAHATYFIPIRRDQAANHPEVQISTIR
ncbi:MAG: hypothetical protein P4L59_00530 [Desulfosporosinus sp.]|nr:hypothetical protein [Desulfosporosinus sp.]